MSTWLSEGQSVPDITLPADDGSRVSLAALRGRVAVVYFYPRDDTPGCTREACAFRDRRAELTARGVSLLGISTDSVGSHQKFRAKYQLNFPLLADVDHRAAEAFGAWQQKNMYGNVSWGVVRSTFLIDAAGVVRKVWRKVNVDGHDAEVLAAVDALVSGTLGDAPPAHHAKHAATKSAGGGTAAGHKKLAAAPHKPAAAAKAPATTTSKPPAKPKATAKPQGAAKPQPAAKAKKPAKPKPAAKPKQAAKARRAAKPKLPAKPARPAKKRG